MGASTTSRRRGRPISDSSQEDEALKARRERNREAQNIFRKRRQAAEAEQTQRLHRLEDVVEEMSSVFMTFVDEMLQTEIVKQHSSLLASLRETMAHVLALANEVVGPEEGNERSSSVLTPEIKARETKRLRVSESWPRMSPPIEYQLDTEPFIHHIPTTTSPSLQRSKSTASSKSSRSSSKSPPAPTSVSTSDTISSIIHQASPTQVTQYTYRKGIHLPASMDTPDWSTQQPQTVLASDSFACRLVYSSLAMGYLVLSHAREAPPVTSEDLDRIFGLTLRSRSREDVLVKMRWLLGPGRAELYRAADMPCGRFGDEEFSHRDLNPEVDDLRGCPLDDPSQSRFLSVVGVEKQLLALGARIVDAETLELNITSPLTLSLDSPHPRPAQPDSWSFVDFFARSSVPSQANSLTLRLSVSLLVSNLSHQAVCLIRGPGFPRDQLGKAIEASIIAVISGGTAT